MGPQARHEYLAQMRGRYLGASRREKGRLLTEAVTVTGYHRKAYRRWCPLQELVLESLVVSLAMVVLDVLVDDEP